MHLVESSDEDFLRQFHSLCQIPCLDCDRCMAACFQGKTRRYCEYCRLTVLAHPSGFVSCPHARSVICFPCLSSVGSYSCRCDSVTAVYRFPLGAQLRVLSILHRSVGQPEQAHGEDKGGLRWDDSLGQGSTDCSDIPGRVPSESAVELLEQSRANPITLGLLGPFVSRPIAKDSATGRRDIESGRVKRGRHNALTRREFKAWGERVRVCLSGDSCTDVDALVFQLTSRSVVAALGEALNESDSSGAESGESYGRKPKRPEKGIHPTRK